MQHKKSLTILVILITLISMAAASLGIFSNEGAGSYQYKSIRGRMVTIYGKGLYKDMSAEVAPQGIAQDYVTLFIGIPLMLISFFMSLNGSVRARLILAGTFGYFLVTYLFYTVMGMYNAMFIGYFLLVGLSFFSFLITLLSFDTHKLPFWFSSKTPVKVTGGYLIFTAVAIAMLWLNIVVPPLLNGTVVPVQTEHYTTLIVQGLDLGILLPSAFIAAILFIRKKPLGYLLCPVYFIFLSVLMTALTAKVIAMSMLGYNVIPVIFIIPTFTILSIVCSIVILRHLRNENLN